MASSKSYFDTVTSEAVYNSLYARTFLSDLAGKSTSGWDEDQLAACRVLVAATPKHNILPILLNNDCIPSAAFQKLLKRDPTTPEGHNSSDLSTVQLQRICQGPGQHKPYTEHQSVWTFGQSLGQLWASLDRVKASGSNQLSGRGLGELQEARAVVVEMQTISDDPGEPDESDGDFSRKRKLPEVDSSPPIARRSTRQVRPRHNPDFARSDQIQVGSSQKSEHVPSSEPDVFYGPPSPKAVQNNYPENLTVQFISSFVRQVLPWLPSQNSPEADPVVVFEDAQANFQVKRSELHFTSRDDGGLVVFCNGRRCSRVALLEAKRFVDSYVEGELSVSNKPFGQMVGEALAARLQPDPSVWAGPDGTIIVMAAARNYLRFLQVSISEAYLTQLKEGAIGENDVLTEFIHVDATRWFDLADAADRRHTVQNLEGIVCLVRKELAGEAK